MGSGESNVFCGFEMEYQGSELHVHQQKYILALLHEHGLGRCNAVFTPGDSSLVNDESDPEQASIELIREA